MQLLSVKSLRSLFMSWSDPKVKFNLCLNTLNPLGTKSRAKRCVLTLIVFYEFHALKDGHHLGFTETWERDEGFMTDSHEGKHIMYEPDCLVSGRRPLCGVSNPLQFLTFCAPHCLFRSQKSWIFAKLCVRFESQDRYSIDDYIDYTQWRVNNKAILYNN